MAGRVRVLTGVPVRGAIATKCDAALLTGAQMNPLRANFYAFSTFADFWLLDRFDGIEMRTAAVAHVGLLLFEAASRR